MPRRKRSWPSFARGRARSRADAIPQAKSRSSSASGRPGLYLFSIRLGVSSLDERYEGGDSIRANSHDFDVERLMIHCAASFQRILSVRRVKEPKQASFIQGNRSIGSAPRNFKKILVVVPRWIRTSVRSEVIRSRCPVNGWEFSEREWGLCRACPRRSSARKELGPRVYTRPIGDSRSPLPLRRRGCR